MVVTFTTAPIPSRLLLVPCRRKVIQCRLVSISFLRKYAGPLFVVTTTLVLPSLSKSPHASPRAAHFSWNGKPDCGETFKNFPLPLFPSSNGDSLYLRFG